MICRTADEAWDAGYNSPCEHGIPDPNDCPECELTPAEIARLVVLHRPYLKPSPVSAAVSAVA